MSSRANARPGTRAHERCIRAATFDASRRHRYRLCRTWDPSRPGVLFVLLNPSTADARRDDATTRRCRTFAEDFGAGGFTLVNLYTRRARDPRDLVRIRSIVGPRADPYLEACVRRASRIVVGWGNGGLQTPRARRVLGLLSAHGPVECLGVTAGGAPRHPLYVKRGTPLVPYPIR